MQTDRPSANSPGNISEHARALALVLGIESWTYAGHEQQAAVIMSHLAALPLIANNSRKHAYGDEILRNTNQLMPPDDSATRAFSGKVQFIVSQMETVPAWWRKLSVSNHDLLAAHHRVKLILWGFALAGFGSFSSVTKKTVKEVHGHTSAPADPNAPKSISSFGRSVGRGAGVGLRDSMTGGQAGMMQLVWVVGAFAAVAVSERKKETDDEITRRVQEGKMTADEYRSAFGRTAALPQQLGPRR